MENQTLNAETDGLSSRLLKTANGLPMFVVAVVAAVTGPGLYLNWPAIVALGIAPLILSFAPCALMCALGLCGMASRKNVPDSKLLTEDDLP
jgi:hypothetical protein